MKTKFEILKATEPFHLLPDDILQEVSELLTEIRFNTETLAYRQEITKMDGVDIIVKGEYETFFFDTNDDKRSIEKHGPNYCFGGISLLVNRKQALKSVIAKKGTVIYKLPRKDFLHLSNAYEEFFQYYANDFGKRMLDEEFEHFFKEPAE